jgi:hypothetical protein
LPALLSAYQQGENSEHLDETGDHEEPHPRARRSSRGRSRSSGQQRNNWRRRPPPSASFTATLHHENVLFDNGEARAIDFDDCGWGFYLYDFAVTLFDLEDRPRYNELRDALGGAYATMRPLPPDDAMHLDALLVLRRIQILLWIIESREHAAFRDEWRSWARDELDTPIDPA